MNGDKLSRRGLFRNLIAAFFGGLVASEAQPVARAKTKPADSPASARNTVVYAFDASNTLTTISTYNSAGRLTAMQDVSAPTTFSYDGYGNLQAGSSASSFQYDGRPGRTIPEG